MNNKLTINTKGLDDPYVNLPQLYVPPPPRGKTVYFNDFLLSNGQIKNWFNTLNLNQKKIWLKYFVDNFDNNSEIFLN